jgi:hypothetical protein
MPLLIAGPPATATESLPSLGASTPSELALRLRAATDSADPIALAALLAPATRAEMCAAMTLGSLMLVGSDEEPDPAMRDARRAELDRILRDHGLEGLLAETPAEDPFRAFEDLDHLTYLREVVRFLSLHFPEESAFPAPGSDSSLIGAPLIEGERGTLVIGTESYGLERIDGRWYLVPPARSETPPAAGVPATP